MSTKKLLQAASGAASGASVYVDDVFSTHLYDGTGSSQTITNGIDLDGEGGLVWFKNRTDTYSHALFDSERSSFGKYLQSNDSAGETDITGHVTAASTGFQLSAIGYNVTNNASGTYASWSFRKQAGFFDVVTYTGTGTGTGERTINHNLGSTPGVIILKDTSAAGDWIVYHRDGTNSGNYKKNLVLNNTNEESGNNFWVNAGITATTFRFNDQFINMNVSGRTYVAYLFAHDDQQFGDDSDESIIKCGSYTGNGSSTGPSVDLGFEPQWLLIKGVGDSDWIMLDVMRGIPTGSNDARLRSNASGAETSTIDFLSVTSTGFDIATNNSNVNTNGTAYTYIAIRRPMKTPTVGTEVFKPVARTGTGTTAAVTGVGFSPDLFIGNIRDTAGYWNGVVDRLRGVPKRLVSSQTEAENTQTVITSFDMDGLSLTSDSNGFANENGKSYIQWLFKRAPGFFDVVAYTGNGASSQAMAHNLTVAPEFIIVKRRDGSSDWICQVPYTSSPQDYMIKLNTNEAAVNFDDAWRDTAPTATNFTVGSWSYVNTNGGTYIAYLFATLAGVSKVGSYTGTGSDINVDCGFSAGARFILIKRTDSTGDWYVWDSVRGIVAGNDPYLLLNSSAVEVTSTDYIDPLSSGFTVTSSAPAALNTSSGEYIFLAIA